MCSRLIKKVKKFVIRKTNEKLTLPTERIGNIMVFKTFDRVSYAYVLDSELPMNLGAKLSPSVVDE